MLFHKSLPSLLGCIVAGYERHGTLVNKVVMASVVWNFFKVSEQRTIADNVYYHDRTSIGYSPWFTRLSVTMIITASHRLSSFTRST